MTSLLRKPLLGGVFGKGEFELATQPTVSNGLHAVKYMVIQLAAGQVVSIAEDTTHGNSGTGQMEPLTFSPK
jgi:hypothetical protein